MFVMKPELPSGKCHRWPPSDFGTNVAQRFRVSQQEGTNRIKNAGFVMTHDFARAAEMSPNVGHGHHWCGNAESYFLIGDALGKAMIELIQETPKTTNWPKWRGPAANGVADDRELATDWSTTKNVLWHVNLPGCPVPAVRPSEPLPHAGRRFVLVGHRPCSFLSDAREQRGTRRTQISVDGRGASTDEPADAPRSIHQLRPWLLDR